MALQARRRGGNGLDIWPGYVDALSTLLMVTIFVLLVFVLAEAFLSAALHGSNNTISSLKSEVAQLSSALNLQKAKSVSLDKELASLESQLAASQATTKTLRGALAASQSTAQALGASLARNQASLARSKSKLAESQSRAASLSASLAQSEAALSKSKSKLAGLQNRLASVSAERGKAQAAASSATQKLHGQEQLNAAELQQVNLLNEQIAALRMQMASLAAALNAAHQKDLKEHVQIADLGRKLNEALARKVQKLQRYRSEFFGVLSKALAGQQDIKVVGDRFVFESSVLFPSDSATLSDQGKQKIAEVAKAIEKIAPKIPSKINWVLSVDGFADKEAITGGPYKNNFDLSSARALAVLHLLIADGVPKNRVIASAFGAEHPIAQGNSKQALAQNRRIEFRLTSAD